MNEYYVEFSSVEYLAKSETVEAYSAAEAKEIVREMYGDDVKFIRVSMR